MRRPVVVAHLAASAGNSSFPTAEPSPDGCWTIQRIADYGLVDLQAD